MEVNCEDGKGESTPLYYAALAGSEKAVGRLWDDANKHAILNVNILSINTETYQIY